MAIAYYPDGNGKLWIKDNIAPYGTNIYYVQKISGYTPDDKKIFDYIDNFNDNTIDETKWFTDGTGTIEEISGSIHIVSNSNNTYPRIVTTIPLTLQNYTVEYNFKITSAASESCRVGYTSYYTDGNDLANWFLYTAGDKKLYFYTRINGDWKLRWSYNTPLSLNTWYKICLIESASEIKVQLLTSTLTLISESEFFKYDHNSQNSIYFGQRSTGDSGYFDNFIVRRYEKTEPTITVNVENDGYRVIVKNNLNEELRDYQIGIPTTNIGSLTTISSICINALYKTPLKYPYYNINNNCILDIPQMNSDLTNNHSLSTYNTTYSIDKFNNTNMSKLFNGINSRGIIYHKTDLNIFNTNNFTLIIWIKQLGDYSSSWCSLLSKAENTIQTSSRWRLRIVNNEVGFVIYDANSNVGVLNISDPIKINDQSWHMITFVRNNKTMYTYKDGILKQTISLSNITNFTNTSNIDIGCAFSNIAYDYFFNGLFGQIKLYDTTFTSNSVFNYYNLTKSKYIPNIVTEVTF